MRFYAGGFIIGVFVLIFPLMGSHIVNAVSPVDVLITSCNEETKNPQLSWSSMTGYARYQNLEWPGHGKISIEENNDVIVKTDAAWADEYAIHKLNSPQKDFTLSACAKLLDDSVSITDFTMHVGWSDSSQSNFNENNFAGSQLALWYDGFYKEWRVSAGTNHLFIGNAPIIPNGKWVQFSIQKTGNGWKFFVDKKLITEIQYLLLPEINFIAFSNGNGGGSEITDVEWKPTLIPGEPHPDNTEKEIVTAIKKSVISKAEPVPQSITKHQVIAIDEMPSLEQKYPKNTEKLVLSKVFSLNAPLYLSISSTNENQKQTIFPFVVAIPVISIVTYPLIKVRIARKNHSE